MYITYEPRRLTFLGIETAAGFKLKLNGLQRGHEPLDRERFVVVPHSANGAQDCEAYTECEG